MTEFLPTFTFNGAITEDLKASLFAALAASTNEDRLDLFYYSASVAGWRLFEPQVSAWLDKKAGRAARAFIGTDHGFTDPRALRSMLKHPLDVYLVTKYPGIYHPKVIVLSGAGGGLAWVGSNNLSEGAMAKNMEFALRATFSGPRPTALANWVKVVEAASEPLTVSLLDSYQAERKAFQKRTKALTRKFVWSRRKKFAGAGIATGPAAPSGALVMEVTQQETGGGRQVQPPLETVGSFFGLPGGPGATRNVRTRMKGTTVVRTHALTRQNYSMARLVISELHSGHRPCFLVFEKVGNLFEYEIVTKAGQPARYSGLQAIATRRTNARSRYWNIAP